MPLIKIPNQPLFSDPNRPTLEGCGRDYCHPIRTDDDIMVQFYQTPCAANEVADPNFENTGLGANLMTKICGSGDIALDASWTCVTPVFDPTFKKTASGLAGYRDVTVNNMGLGQNKLYEVTFTVENSTQGSVRFLLGNIATGSTGGFVSGNNTYTQYIWMFDTVFGNDKMHIEGTSDFQDVTPGCTECLFPSFDGDVHSITVKEVTQADWSNGSGTWEINGDGKACKLDNTTSGNLTESGANYIAFGDLYLVEVTLIDYVSGTLTVEASGEASASFSGNGTSTFYLTPTAGPGVIEIIPTTDFVGCVSEVNVQALRNDYSITLTDFDTQSEIQDLSSFISYYNEFVTLSISPDDMALDSGCYRLYAYDECDVQHQDIAPNGDLNGGGTPFVYDEPVGWFNNGSTNQIDWSANQCKMKYTILADNGTMSAFSVKIPELVAGNYELTFTVTSTDPLNIGIAATLSGIPVTTFYTAGTHTITFNNYVPDANQRIGIAADFNLQDNILPTVGNATIDTISLNRIAPFSATYESECMKFGGEFSKTLLFTGTNDTNVFGFEFENTGFRLSQRLETRSMQPNWGGSRDDYTFSTGITSTNYAEVKKTWQLFIEAAPESSHGTVALQINSDHFLLGDNYADSVEYQTEDGEYSPEWERSGAADIAPARLEISIKEGTLFNRRC